MAQVASIFNVNAAAQVNRTGLSVQIEPSQLRPIAFRVFTKKYNLTLKSDALKVLAAHIGHKCGQSWRTTCEPVLDEIAKSWTRAQETEPIVSEAELLPIIKALDVAHVPRPATLAREDTLMIDATAVPQDDTDPRKFLNCIDAFTQPIYHFSHQRQLFEHDTSKPAQLPDPEVKPKTWLERYHYLKARILRHEQFQAPTFHHTGTYHKLTQVKNLLGRQGSQFMLFGLLTIGSDGKYYLEDADDRVQLDFTEATCGAGWFCPGCFVLVDGVYTEEEIFHVAVMGQPPPETRRQTRNTYPGTDMLGSGIERSQEKHLQRAKQTFRNERFVFCSNCHLDDPRCLKALRAIFSNYESSPPLAIVLIGDFIKIAHHTDGFSSTYKELWDSLAAIIEDYPDIARKSKFIFVPGSKDPWSLAGNVVLPRHGIPKAFTNRIHRICKDATFTSNPCRLQYFTQEIVILRDDLIARMRRTSVSVTLAVVNEPSDKSLMRTIIDQAHLSPFPMSIRPIHWSLSSSLRLLPSPSVLVLADGVVSSSTLDYNDVTCISTGNLLVSKECTWSEYCPATRQAEKKTVYIQ